MKAAILSILQEYWGHPGFRPLQQEIIETVLEGKDCLALLPTGGGKSICFQVPALAKNGLCLVVSPLIALMKDQVEHLRKKNITAFAIHSGMSRKEVTSTLTATGSSNCRFLYVSPERLQTRLFQEFLPSLGIQLIAVDEAHCISQWGYDFRPSYRQISNLRAELPGVPVLALTASATPKVQQDICQQLQFSDHRVFLQSFARPNLSYSAFNTTSRINRIIEILQKVPGSAIVYTRTRKRTRELSELLNARGLAADFYHAGLNQDERNRKQEAWVKNETRIIVCTNAFGMGIDKPDVRVVVHADMPDCLENYYQEAGRAGRDGKPAYAVLLFDESEKAHLSALHHTRFPSLDTIRTVYGSLMNHLQIPSGSGEGQSYEIDVPDFSRYFQISPTLALSVFKILEQENLLYFTEQVFTPSRVQVTGSRETIRYAERDFPALWPLIQTLLRTYEGIVDQPVNVYENSMAHQLRLPASSVNEQLNTLHLHGIIRYFPQKDKPQVLLLHNRVRAEDLYIDMEAYLQRREEFIKRTAAMAGYATDSGCRSVSIARYFGDKQAGPCGRCDNCLQQKRSPVSQQEFEAIRKQIGKLTQKTPLTLQQLLAQFNGIPAYKVREVVRFLAAEDKLVVSGEGLISLK